MFAEKETIRNVIEEIPANKAIYLSGHENIDDDAITSSLALTRYLNQIGKTAYFLVNQEDEAKLDWFADRSYLKNKIEEKEYIFIMMDAPKKERLGKFETYFDQAKLTINIDHHEQNKEEANYILSIPEISATCEIVYELIKDWKEKIDAKIASLLFAGIVSDTYCFFQRTTPQTFRVVSELLEYQIDNQKIIKEVYLEKTKEEVAVLQKMLANIQYDGFHYIVMDKSEDPYQKVDDDVMFRKCITTVQNIKEIKVLGLFLKGPDVITGQFRSNCEIEVEELGEKFGGVGHKKSCGFITTKKVEEIIQIAKEFLNKN